MDETQKLAMKRLEESVAYTGLHLGQYAMSLSLGHCHGVGHCPMQKNAQNVKGSVFGLKWSTHIGRVFAIPAILASIFLAGR